MADWRLFYYSITKNREAFSSHESLEGALNAAWNLSWCDGSVLRIEGLNRKKLDAASIEKHPKKAKWLVDTYVLRAA